MNFTFSSFSFFHFYVFLISNIFEYVGVLPKITWFLMEEIVAAFTGLSVLKIFTSSSVSAVHSLAV